MIFMRDRYLLHVCILEGISSGSFATPAQYEYKFVVTCRNMMYLICINLGLEHYAPSASVNTIQIHHSYTCYNYNVGLTIEKLTTTLAQVKACLNLSSLLTAMPDLDKGNEVLLPDHFQLAAYWSLSQIHPIPFAKFHYFNDAICANF